jgi:C4-type Zn-finger protein
VGVFRDLREVVKNLKHRKAEANIYCPCCGSPRLRLVSGVDFWLNPGKRVCLDCGYRGFIVMENEEGSGKEETPR